MGILEVRKRGGGYDRRDHYLCTSPLRNASLFVYNSRNKEMALEVQEVHE